MYYDGSQDEQKPHTHNYTDTWTKGLFKVQVSENVRGP